MERLDNELDQFINKLRNAEEFKKELKDLKSVYPFNIYEYKIAYLLANKIMSFSEYLELRTSHIKKNKYLYLFEKASRSFGDTWGLDHLITIEPSLEKPNKKIDSSYTGEYDLCLSYSGKIIKIEVKASRMQDRNRRDSLIAKAYYSEFEGQFQMNFQQLKPSCCDVFIWIVVYRDRIDYWVLKNSVIQKHNDFSPQHRNEATKKRSKKYSKSDIYEGQIIIKNTNIDSIKDYKVDEKELKEAIIKQYEAE